MRKTVGVFAGWSLLAVLLVGSVARAQDARVTIADERPVAKAAEILEGVLHVPVTYEDTLYFSGKDMADVTSLVVRGPRATTAPVLVPRRQGLTFSLPAGVAADGGTQAASVSRAVEAVDAMLADFRAGGNLDLFSVQGGTAAVHVVSRRFRDAAGALVDFRPFLDVFVTIGPARRPALVLIEEILRAVSKQGRIKLELGTVPVNLLAERVVSVGAGGQAARTVLGEIVRQTGKPMSWQVFCDPGDGGCALNMHVVR